MSVTTDTKPDTRKARRRTPKPLKRFLQSAPFRAFLYATLANYLRLLRSTTRWTVVREEIPRAYWDRDEGFILGCWHGRNIVMPLCWRSERQVSILASQHKDGDITENVLKRLGLKALRGSSGNPEKGKMAKGGATALRNMARLIQAKESIVITPDGPRGPRMRASEGIAAVARLTGAPVIPCAVSIRSARLLNTWDRLLVPFPFSRGAIVWGQPIFVARDSDPAALEAARRAIEAGITSVLQEADALFGRERVEPAAEPSKTA